MTGVVGDCGGENALLEFLFLGGLFSIAAKGIEKPYLRLRIIFLSI
jgi:hypothetical protein